MSLSSRVKTRCQCHQDTIAVGKVKITCLLPPQFNSQIHEGMKLPFIGQAMNSWPRRTFKKCLVSNMIKKIVSNRPCQQQYIEPLTHETKFECSNLVAAGTGQTLGEKRLGLLASFHPSLIHRYVQAGSYL
jgi:hypothetical protein